MDALNLEQDGRADESSGEDGATRGRISMGTNESLRDQHTHVHL